MTLDRLIALIEHKMGETYTAVGLDPTMYPSNMSRESRAVLAVLAPILESQRQAILDLCDALDELSVGAHKAKTDAIREGLED